MTVNELIKLLKSNGIKGNSEVEGHEFKINSIVIYTIFGEQKVVLTHDPEEIKKDLKETRYLRYVKTIKLEDVL